jgi:hypothetical protein
LTEDTICYLSGFKYYVLCSYRVFGVSLGHTEVALDREREVLRGFFQCSRPTRSRLSLNYTSDSVGVVP